MFNNYILGVLVGLATFFICLWLSLFTELKKERSTKFLVAGGCIASVIAILISFISPFFFTNFSLFDGKKIATYGAIGDALGGLMNPFIAIAAVIVTGLAFYMQYQANQQIREQFQLQQFEAQFYEMLRLHRQNVTELTYRKFASKKLGEAHNRKVFRYIFKEFLECFREVKKFSNSKNPDDYLLRRQKQKLSYVINENNSKISIIELSLIDIAYSIVYFGVGEEGEIVLRDKFKKKYRHEYFYPLLKFIKLKPKREIKNRWNKWEELLTYPYKQFKSVNEEFYNYRKHLQIDNLSHEAKALIYKKDYDKYYGGHQFRLGHYYRHLFQSYKYLNYHNGMSDATKKTYGKMLRAQMSTYEQALLFVNSLSSLGMKWEFTPEYDLLNDGENRNNCKLITRYNLIKNLPGNHFFGLTYQTYYPKINYENNES